MSGTFQGRLAYASCNIAAGPTIAFNAQSGDFDETPLTPMYGGAGNYILTLSSPVDPNEAVYQISCRSAVGTVRVASIVSPLATTLQIEVLDETGANADPVGFDLTIVVKPAN